VPKHLECYPGSFSFTTLDPLEDTESVREKRRARAGRRVSPRSIRLRILKETFRLRLDDRIPVSPRSIRLRILKGTEINRSLENDQRFTTLDPLEDTERRSLPIDHLRNAEFHHARSA